MPAARATPFLRLPTLALLGFVLSLVVFAAMTSLDRNGDRQKEAQLLVSELEGRVTRLQDVPWDADAAGRNDPAAVVRARLYARAARIRGDLGELARIERTPLTRRLLAELGQNLALLDRQLGAVAAGDDPRANRIGEQSGAAADRLRSDLTVVGRRFHASSAAASRYTFAGTAALLLALYTAFALTLTLLVRTQRQSAAKSQRLRQAQKMEAIGRLAGGIAHDFNNLLLAIRGYGELVEAALPPDAAARSDIRALIASTDRASTLTSQLLAFSREQKLSLAVVDANAVVSEVMTLLDRLIGEQIEVELELASEIPLIECDASQLGQVIVNLAVNARDAMPGGGRLTIGTSRAEVFRSAGSEEAGPWVVLSVSDTGSGIDEETLDRIFDPFFTTKEAGTGLGLATVSGIVAQSRGQLTVDTKLGRGTTFHVFLPATQKPLEAPEPAAPPAQAAPVAGRILVVDDNDTVRLIVARMLADRGFVVDEARNGDEALELCARTPDGFDLLVTDLAMPGMSGHELGRRLGHLPVLYMSGHPGHFSEDETRPTAFIQKPFSTLELTQAVDALLAQACSPAPSPT
jgi:two-component system cell cycle sensor histidine kinase/response regulator CckA